MITFFDTETTGLPVNWKAPMTDLDNWPRVIQLAWRRTDLTGARLAGGNYLIYPDGWTVPDGSKGEDWTFWREHGFSTASCMAGGVPMDLVADKFLNDVGQSQYLVSHNMSYDHNVLGAEMLRYGKKAERRPVRICTKEASTAYCKIPFPGRRMYPGRPGQDWKWPKLDELHRKLFDRGFEDAHDADGDVAALANCFFELVRLGVIKLDPLP